MFGLPKKKQAHLAEMSREFDNNNGRFSALHKEYVSVMKQLHRTETTDFLFKQKMAAIKAVYDDSVHSQKIAKKYREEYLFIS